MEISPQALERLKEVHKNLTGEDLAERELREMAEKLFELVLAVYKPIPIDSQQGEHVDNPLATASLDRDLPVQ